MTLLLASTSPRRRELLALLSLPFETDDPQVVETLTPGLSPEIQARQFALDKARASAGRFPGRWVLGADTLIAVGPAVLGKPADLAEAGGMLRQLCGREHLVYTAAALVRADGADAEAETTVVRVRMRAFSEAELEAYLQTGESLGKAGGYSIQGRGGDLIDRIDGDFTAAVGLPLRLVAGMLASKGLGPLCSIEALYRDKPYPNWARFTP